MEATIKSEALTKRYDERAVVDNLTLEVAAGEVFGLLGPNGAGKTTTILMLLGLVEPTSGSIAVLGMDPRRHPLQVKRRVGFLPDAVGFYDTMSGRQNLGFTARLNGVVNADDVISDLLEQVGLTDAADQLVGEYSRGMKQRLGLADALVKDPAILILDEPTTAIDPEGVAEMLGLIRSLATDSGVTVLLSSHLLHQVQAVCDRVAIFVNGRVVAQGRPHELASQQDGPIRVEFRFEGDQEAARNRLDTIGTVTDVTPGRVPGSWIVGIEPASLGETVRELVSPDVSLTGIHRMDDDLDAIYRRYFETHDEEVPA
ncbi:MAG TPA: ABC transporter ATP-binding protein [Acidimicrobiia bacterium]|nr:ABC transporter ATP-binding protein [Acidimicrobiia bacterium]